MKMKKIILILITIFIVLFLFTSCDNNKVEVVYDLDEHIIDVSVPLSDLAENYKAIVDKTSYTIVEIKNDVAVIRINASNVSIEELDQQVGTIKNEMKQLLPGYAKYIDSLAIGLARDYFGSSIAGTTYYHYTLASDGPGNINMIFKSKNPFALDSNTAVRNADGIYTLTFNTAASSTPSQHELEYTNLNIKDISITFKVDNPTPQMIYKANHNHTDINVLRSELESFGMNVEFIDTQQVIFYEKFDTIDDFNALISARLYAMFGMVTMVNYKHSSFLTSDGQFEFTLYSKHPDSNIYIQVEGGENTEFVVSVDEKTQTLTQKVLNIDAQPGINIQAKYSNVRWFQAMTSMLAIMAMGVALVLMIYLAKRK